MVDVFLAERSHHLFSQLLASQRSIDESSGFLLIEFEDSLSPLNLVMASEVSIGIDDRSIVTIFLLVLPVGRFTVIPISQLVVLPVHRDGRIRPNILSQGKLDDSVNRECLIWLDKHLSSHPVALDVLVEGIVSQLNTAWSLMQYFCLSQTSVFESLHLLVNCKVHFLFCVGRHEFKRPVWTARATTIVDLILTNHFLLLVSL